MAKNLKIFSQLCLGVATALTLSFAVSHKPAYACSQGAEDGTNCTSYIEEEVTFEESYAFSDDNLNADVTTDHSVFLAGNEVSASNHTEGVSFVAGNLVDFSGSTEYGFFAGNSVKVAGSVQKDLFLAGNAVELTEDALLGRDLFAAGKTVLIKTNLPNNVFATGSRLVLEDVTIDGDLNVAFDEIIIKGKSSIAGKFIYNDSAQITGFDNLAYGATETFTNAGNNINLTTSLKTKILFLLSRLLLTIILIAIAPKFTKKLLENFKAKESWKDFLLGLGLLLGVPLAAIFIAITLIGLPLSITLIGVYIFLIYIAHSITGGIFGDIFIKKVLKKKIHVFAEFTIGTTVVVLLTMIPVVGTLISILSIFFGMGYFARMLARKN